MSRSYRHASQEVLRSGFAVNAATLAPDENRVRLILDCDLLPATRRRSLGVSARCPASIAHDDHQGRLERLAASKLATGGLGTCGSSPSTSLTEALGRTLTAIGTGQRYIVIRSLVASIVPKLFEYTGGEFLKTCALLHWALSQLPVSSGNRAVSSVEPMARCDKCQDTKGPSTSKPAH